MAWALAKARIIAQQAGAPLRHGTRVNRCGLAALHVAHVAGQKHDQRSAPCRMAKGDPAPVGHDVELDGCHAADHDHAHRPMASAVALRLTSCLSSCGHWRRLIGKQIRGINRKWSPYPDRKSTRLNSSH